MRNALVVLFSVCFICACSGPAGPIAGGKLDGTPAAWPADWAFTESIDNVLLQTRPQDPYSVTTWLVTYDGNIYIAAASKYSNWVQNIEKNADVIISVQGTLYQARAAMVTSNAEAAGVIQAYLVKYDIDSEEAFVEEDGLLFRLSQR